MTKELRIKLFSLFSFSFGLIAFSLSLIYNWTFFTFPAYIFGFLIPFLALLESQINRVSKGFGIILYGICWGIIIPNIFSEFIPVPLSDNFEILENLIVFSCSGAGASVIAHHAEESYNLNRIEKAKEIIVDNTEQIKNLISTVENLRKSIIVLQFICFFLLITTIFAIIN